METVRNFFILFILCAVFYQWAYPQGCEQPHYYPQYFGTYTVSDSASIESISEFTYKKEKLDQKIYDLIKVNNLSQKEINEIWINTIDGYSYYDWQDEANSQPICEYQIIIKLNDGSEITEGKIVPESIYGPAYSTKRIKGICEGSFIN